MMLTRDFTASGTLGTGNWFLCRDLERDLPGPMPFDLAFLARHTYL